MRRQHFVVYGDQTCTEVLWIRQNLEPAEYVRGSNELQLLQHSKYVFWFKLDYKTLEYLVRNCWIIHATNKNKSIHNFYDNICCLFARLSNKWKRIKVIGMFYLVHLIIYNFDLLHIWPYYSGVTVNWIFYLV